MSETVTSSRPGDHEQTAGGALLVGVPGSTAMVLTPRDGDLPRLDWVGWLPEEGLDPDDVSALVGQERGVSLLVEAAHGNFGRPGLSGYRLGPPRAGRDWSPRFVADALEQRRVDGQPGMVVRATDEVTGLRLTTELEAVEGGLLRARHCVTNIAPDPYVVEWLEVAFPLPDRVRELLDFTGRWGRERTPQRHQLADGVWLRENRHGKTGHDAATILAAGTTGFGFGHGEVWGVHTAWSGNHRTWAQREGTGTVTIGGGELLLPGEVVLEAQESYTTPWVYLGASNDGLDGLAAAFHRHIRSLPAHPSSPRPVNLNVWEAVYFDHDLDRLRRLADLAAQIGVERYVLDDGWFLHRRNDSAGLGDWVVDPAVWPEGLSPLIDHVRGLGMAFGLWFEPEMINPDSDLYRAHPEWILATGGRQPVPQRQQQVLDLTRPEAAQHVFERVDAILTTYPIDYVKWDHNRDLVDAGSSARHGAPAVHDQTEAFYGLFDRLRAAHPQIEWESCAGGGGRIDLAVIGRTQRVWTSDMTDALARQTIQRWTAQLLPLEYLGTHVSAPTSHQTGRTFSLDFRAVTALFGHFGIEWDLTAATTQDLERLGGWIDVYKRHRALLHTGRLQRMDNPEPGVYQYGVVAGDGSEALVASAQLDSASHPQPTFLRVAGLRPDRVYRVARVEAAGEVELRRVSGAAIAQVGLPLPPQRPETALLLHVQEVARRP